MARSTTPTLRRDMNLDSAIEELDKLVKYRGPGGLIEAVSRAPRLLRQRRYRAVPSAQRSARLAADIRWAVKGLPPEFRAAASGLLPIDWPNESIGARERRLGVSGFSGPGRRWHRTAILGFVATALLRLYEDTPTFQLHKLGIRVRDQLPYMPIKGILGVPQPDLRVISFEWDIESLVTDLRQLTFRFGHGHGLKYRKLQVKTDQEVHTVSRVAIPGTRNTHWYTHYFVNALPYMKRCRVTTSLEYKKSDNATQVVSFWPSSSAKQLTMAAPFYVERGERHPGSLCAEVNTEQTVVRRFPSVSFPLNDLARASAAYAADPASGNPYIDEELYSAEVWEHRHTIRSPKVGRGYIFDWSSSRDR